MADFRRWITVLAVLALFTGLASAQINIGGAGGSAPFACAVGQGGVGTTPLTIRSEGYTELLGDIVISCTGGTQLANLAAIPQANIVVSLPATVTSRLLGTSNSLGSGQPSEALLMIDEPNSGLPTAVPGYGPGADLVPCLPGTLPTSGGCAAVVGQVAFNGGTINVANQSGTTTPAQNVYVGAVGPNANQIVFYGVPILPPGTSGISRVFRVTNLRINANVLPSGAAGTIPVTAFISTNNPSALPLSNSQQVVGYTQQGLTTSVNEFGSSGSTGNSNLVPFPQCTAQTVALASVIRFRELFGTAFKTRVAPVANTSYAAQGQNLGAQNAPGAIYNSESGFIATNKAGGVIVSGGNFSGASTSIAGLTDYGTRLKATFTNVPAGVSVYITVTNTTSSGVPVAKAPVPTPPAPPLVPAVPGGTATISYAQAVPSETVSDAASSFSFLALTGTTAIGGGSGTDVIPVTISGGTGTAVWEVVNANPNAIDTLYFGVYISYTPNLTATPATPVVSPAAQVTMTYAPTPAGGAFTTTTGPAARFDLTVPRFADTGTAANMIALASCQTTLLWPYTVNVAGFDTGLAIANTSTDPFGTTGSQGVCGLYFYGSTPPAATTTACGNLATNPGFCTPAIPTGTVYANNVGSIAPGFNGYVIGVCNFQYAHGYAALIASGGTVSQMFSSYLALVLGPGGVTRSLPTTSEIQAH